MVHSALTQEIIEWSESKRQAGAKTGALLTALCEALLEIPAKDDVPLRLAFLEQAQVRLTAQLKREHHEYAPIAKYNGLHVVPPTVP